ncbi:MAG TPA: fused MFS/spermidine synthase [Thermomicrobiales bacterium]|nr:fused MFS/spermidine synthase [Thermomicrobiales bacterium]
MTQQDSNATYRQIDGGLLRLIVFFGGITSVGTEVAASRLVAPYFGTSTFIWANLIGITLTFLAIGYWIGGRIADRYPRAWVLYATNTVAALWSILLPYLAQPILRISLDAFEDVNVGAFYGSLLGVLLLLAVPITLLGFVTPYAVRLLLDAVENAGDVSGGIYALSTIGSILGSFLPVLLLIPWIGTARTFLVLGLILLVPSLVGFWRLRSWRVSAAAVVTSAVVLFIPFVATPENIRPAERGRLIYETESSDNYIQVLEEDGRYLLALNDGHAVHSIYDPDELLTRGPWDYFMIGPLFVSDESPAQIEDALVIGLAGGTSSKQITKAYGPVPIDGVEIDPAIVEVGRKYFDMNEPNLNVIVEDGRYVLRTSDKSYDLIAVDAYKQPYIPFQLTTKEFFQETYDHLDEDGTLVINVGRTEDDYRLVDVISSTMKSVYPHVYLIDVERYHNTMVVATKSPSSIDTFIEAVESQPEGSLLKTVGERSIDTGDIREVTTVDTVFTDDHAPIERVVDLIILDEAREESSP